MARRFGDCATVDYFDVTDAQVAASHPDILGTIREQSLSYPVTVIDGVPLYDGGVSYPAILRAVGQRLEATSAP
jgi:hypothetical protein